MTGIEVSLGQRSYQILLKEGLLAGAGEELRRHARNRRVFIISDENVWAAWGEALAASVAQAGLEPIAVILPPGEQSKSWAGVQDLTEQLLSRGVERGEHLIAFGGGVIGDLVGFAASILMRGCPYIQIPTTLLAQVDSSVGGKTAINVASGKNMIGAFHQPSAVLIDPLVLKTLPERHLRAGYAEVVKYGLIDDAAFFGWCEANGGALLGGDVKAQVAAIESSVRSKARMVADDETETNGRRALLNLGHTFGHALEAETGFSERLLHGEAVAIGINLAFRFSAQRGLCSKEVADRVEEHLRSSGLPISVQAIGPPLDADALIAHMAKDKKKSAGTLPFILVRGIGSAYLDHEVDLADVASFLRQISS